MTAYILAHGAWHSPHVWDSVAQLLRAQHHAVITPDLGSDQVDLSTADYARLIADSCVGNLLPVVVGHTSAALALPLVPALIGVQRLVYVNPLLPLIGASFADQAAADDFDNTTEDGREYDRDARSSWNDKHAFARLLAADCDAATVDRLWNQLRPQARRAIREITPLIAWPQVESSAILYTDDADLPVDWMRKTIRERLAIDPVELPGSQLGFNGDPQRFVETLLRF